MNTTDAPPDPHIPVVGIGASAGGLSAFKAFFGRMPADTGLAFILVPHLDPTHESLMVDLLARHTRMTVCEITDGLSIESNCVYVIPPNRHLAISNGRMSLSTPGQRHGSPTAIDAFFRSLANERRERAIGIVLSGTSSHGTAGLKEIKLAGGMVMAQAPESAEYAQMPLSAIATGLVDYVLAPEDMPGELMKYVGHPYVRKTIEEAEAAADRELLDRILAIIRTRSRSDFRSYRKNMLIRRILRRMGLCHIEHMNDYVDYLRKHEQEVDALCRDLLIGVTEFFRDPEAFEFMAQRIIPKLVQRAIKRSQNAAADDAGQRPRARVWIPACSTGEEAYSLAILLFEHISTEKPGIDLQIFATDVDDVSLDVARRGVYSQASLASVSPARLLRFFNKIDSNQWQVKAQLRDVMTFAAQNLIGDAPFSRLDLVSCRNLLIYLEPDVQARVIALFHFALIDGGHLFLGPSESIGRESELFRTLSKKWRVFERIGVARRNTLPIWNTTKDRQRGLASARFEPASAAPSGFKDLMQRLVLQQFAPAAALINRKHEIVSVLGPLVNFLEFPPGEITNDLLAMARPGLRTRIRAAIQKSIQTGEPVIDRAARVRRDGAYVACMLAVRPILEPEDAAGLLLMTFQDRERPEVSTPGTRQGAAEEHDESALVQQLEQDLRSTREDLQTTISEYENSAEELKASNEEMMSMNEELQSANEELESSKEELQSLNEELSTVNNQLQDKIEELDRSNSDLNNLILSSQVATAFLDLDLNIQRFTPQLSKLLGLLPTDVGRPLADFALPLADDDLLPDCRSVIDSLAAIDREVWSKERTPSQPSRCYLRRIFPYREADNRIAGVVMTLVDITERIAAETRTRRLAMILRDSNDAVTVQDFDGRISAWNRGAERIYGYSEEEALHRNVTDMVPAHRQDETRGYLQALAAGEPIGAFETQRIAKDGRILNVELTLTAYRDEDGQPIGIATTERDISDRVRMVADLEQLNRTLEQRVTAQTAEIGLLAEAISHLGEGVVITADHLDWPGPEMLFVNDAMCRITGYTRGELIGQSPRLLQGPDTQVDKLEQIRAQLAEQRTCLVEVTNYRKDGTPYDAELFITALFDSQGQRTNFVSIHRDISDRKAAERSLAAQETLARAILDSLSSPVAVLDATGLVVRVNRLWQWFADANRDDTWHAPAGENQRTTWRRAAAAGDQFAGKALDGLQQVLDGTMAEPEFRLEYPIQLHGETHWYLLSITPIGDVGGGAVVAQRSITDLRRVEETLRRDHEILDQLVRTAQTVILTLDLDGRIVQFNPYLEWISGWTLAEVRGRSWFDTFLPEADRMAERGLFARAIAGERTRGNISMIVTKGGERRAIEWFDAPLTGGDGAPIGLLCSGQDVTDRIRAEEALRAREERLRTILNTAADAIITINRRGVIQTINPATEKLFGFAEAELIGRNVSVLMPPPYRDEHDGYIARYVETKEPRIIGIGRELIARRKDGSDFPMDLAVSEVDTLGLFTGIIRDASARKELQQRILDIAESEQRRIGQDLHDGTGQELTGLALFAGTLTDLLDKSAPAQASEPAEWLVEDARMRQIRDIAERLSAGLLEANQHVTQLSHGIMPVRIELEGLSTALERLASNVDAMPGLTCKLLCPAPVRVTNTATATHLYRIAQEAVNNAVRHSRAKLIQISVLHRDGELVLEVTDDGIGLERSGTAGAASAGAASVGAVNAGPVNAGLVSAGAEGSPARRGFGLEILNHRAGLIGGTMRISGRDTGGTLVRCVVPLRALQVAAAKPTDRPTSA